MVSVRAEFSSPGGDIRFSDTRDHFESAVLRLMAMTEGQFERWLSLAEEHSGTVLERLGAALPDVGHLAPDDPPGAFPVDTGPFGPGGEVWVPSIAGATEHGVAIDAEATCGWLVRLEDARWVYETAPPVYEEAYFEGDQGAYGHYADQEPWRVDKARAQLREITERFGLPAGRALDVGSSYGYFRVALAESGWRHEGFDVSAFARRVAYDRFGFETRAGTIDEHAEGWAAAFDLISLWDVVEHVADPVALLTTIAGLLRPGGVLAVRTPSLDCPEREFFGAFYHSLQRPHLLYFTPASLAATAERAGLEPIGAQTQSHLLSGFVGEPTVTEWAASGRGSDFTAYFRRP
jgi:2-polyprenyl-3-methyl-5-hydroxy-6-metoxy-1,4-benzoquinol methylase